MKKLAIILLVLAVLVGGALAIKYSLDRYNHKGELSTNYITNQVDINSDCELVSFSRVKNYPEKYVGRIVIITDCAVFSYKEVKGGIWVSNARKYTVVGNLSIIAMEKGILSNFLMVYPNGFPNMNKFLKDNASSHPYCSVTAAVVKGNPLNPLFEDNSFKYSAIVMKLIAYDRYGKKTVYKN